MRLPLLVTALVLGSMAYRYYGKNQVPSGKTIFSWSFILVFLTLIRMIPDIEPIANVFFYVIILIIVLNDGYDLAQSF